VLRRGATERFGKKKKKGQGMVIFGKLNEVNGLRVKRPKKIACLMRREPWGGEKLREGRKEWGKESEKLRNRLELRRTAKTLD